MKAKIKKQGNTVKAIVKLSSSEHMDDEKRMVLESVYLPGFFKLEQIKNRKICYTGNTAIPLTERLQKKISENEFYLLIEQLVIATKRLTDHSLSLQQLDLDMNHICINELTKELQFLYVPIQETVTSCDVLSFISSLIYEIKPTDLSEAEFITDFVYFIRSLNAYKPEQIERYIEHKNRKIVQMLRYQSSGSDAASNVEDKTDVLDEDDESTFVFDEDETTLLIDEEEPTEYIDIGNTDESYEDEKTEMIHYPMLVRCSTDECIQIDRMVFRIGKDQKSVDYAIRNNPAISGSHIDVFTRGQHCYVMDLNSKNRTFINRRVIPAEVETEIFDGDQLTLANEDFIFHRFDQL